MENRIARNGAVGLSAYIKKNYQLYLFVLPALAAVVVFCYLPYPGMYLAFVKYDVTKGIWGSDFVGIQHFISLFSDPSFIRVMRNTLAISLIGFAFGFPLPIVFAILLNEFSLIKFKKFVQTASYLPHFVSWVAVAGMMYQIFNGNNGIVNDIREFIGLERINYFGEPTMFWGVSVFIAIWKGLGWASIIYLAGISSINPELYEASAIDGAGRFKRVRHITLPGLMPTITILLILNAGSIFSGAGITPGFDGVFNLSNSVVSEYSDILDIFIYKQGLRQMHYDFATAMGLLFGIVNMALVLAANHVANKTNNSGII